MLYSCCILKAGFYIKKKSQYCIYFYIVVGISHRFYNFKFNLILNICFLLCAH